MLHLSKIIAAGMLLISIPSFAAIPVVLYKSPECGCCEEYIRYLSAQGFSVNATNIQNMDGIKKSFGSDQLASCHTMIISGYTVEGHVPVAAIHKLLKTKPQITGISVPGMPANSPGMGPQIKGTLKVYQIAKNQSGEPKLFSIE